MSNARRRRRSYALSGGLSVVASDSFVRGNNANLVSTPVGSKSWVNAFTIGMGIVSNRALANSTSSLATPAGAYIDSGVVNGTFESTYQHGNSEGGVMIYVDPNNYIAAYSDGWNGNRFRLLKTVAGVQTLVADIVGYDTSVVPQTATLVRNGTSYTAYGNSVVQVSGATISDAVFNGVTKQGLITLINGAFGFSAFSVKA